MKHVVVARGLLEDVLGELDADLSAGLAGSETEKVRDRVARSLGRPSLYALADPVPPPDCGLCGAPVGTPHNQEAHYAATLEDYGSDELSAA